VGVGVICQVMNNMGNVLKAAGSSFDDVVKTTILLSDMSDFAKVNEVYSRCELLRPPSNECAEPYPLASGVHVRVWWWCRLQSRFVPGTRHVRSERSAQKRARRNRSRGARQIQVTEHN
jgi:hypothetical protein